MKYGVLQQEVRESLIKRKCIKNFGIYYRSKSTVPSSVTDQAIKNFLYRLKIEFPSLTITYNNKIKTLNYITVSIKE